MAGLRVDPRTKVLDFADLETTASGPGFSKLSIPGVPAWADAIAKRRAPDEPMAEPRDRVEPVFDERAALSCSPEARLALGPAVRAAMLEALVHSPAVRLGEGRAEAIVPAARARERAVQDAVLTIARSFTGPEDVLDRILRWALEDDAAAMRRACVSWLLRNAPQTPRTWDVLKRSLEDETDDKARLETAVAIGIDAANVIEQLAVNGSDLDVRARAISMLPSIVGDEDRLDGMLLGFVRTSGGMLHVAALEAIVSSRRPLGRTLVAELSSGKHIADAIIRLADPACALVALQAAKQNEDVATTLERIRIAAALGGREVVEPLRAFLSAGNPRELAGPTRKAIDEVKSRLTGTGGAISVAEGVDARGRLSPASKGGELSQTPGAGALSDPAKKRS